MNELERDLSYYAEQGASRQWRFFLQALAEQMSEEVSPEELRGVMQRLGQRMAASLPLGEVKSLDDFTHSINALLREVNWGRAEVSESQDGLTIVHHCSPLAGGFGENAMVWSPAVLEGLYGAWMNELGAGENGWVLQQAQAWENALQPIIFRMNYN